MCLLALGLSDKIGNFAVGKEFDALRVNGCVPFSPYDVFSHDSFDDIISKFLHLGECYFFVDEQKC